MRTCRHVLRRMLRALLRDERGTASIEAAVMLPFFIIAWAGLLYTYTGQDTLLKQRTLARHCAWAYSNSGCETLPPGCEAMGRTAMPSDGAPDWSSVPVLGTFVPTFFGEMVTVGSSQELQRPPLFGGGTANATAPYSIMCNERYRSMGEILHDTMCDQLGDPDFMGC